MRINNLKSISIRLIATISAIMIFALMGAMPVKAANDALDNGLTTFDDECRRLSGKSFRQTIQQLKNEINFAHQMGFNPHILEDNNGKDAYPEQTGNVPDSDVDNDDEE